MSLRASFPSCGCIQWLNCGRNTLVVGTIASLFVLVLGGMSCYLKTQFLAPPGNWIVTGTGLFCFSAFTAGLVRFCRKGQQGLNRKDNKPKGIQPSTFTTTHTSSSSPNSSFWGGSSSDSRWDDENMPKDPSRSATLKRDWKGDSDSILISGDGLSSSPPELTSSAKTPESPTETVSSPPPPQLPSSLSPREQCLKEWTMSPPPPLSLPPRMPAMTAPPQLITPPPHVGYMKGGGGSRPQSQTQPNVSTQLALSPAFQQLTPEKINGLFIKHRIQPH